MGQHSVSFINKTDSLNTHERIRNLGGYNADNTIWKIPQRAMIAALDAGKYEFFVMINGRTFDIIVATSKNGCKYLKTAMDGEEPNSLLSLPECP